MYSQQSRKKKNRYNPYAGYDESLVEDMVFVVGAAAIVTSIAFGSIMPIISMAIGLFCLFSFFCGLG